MSRVERRTILKAIAASVAAPPLVAMPYAGWAQVVPTPRQRLEDFVAQPARLAALKRGVAAMKARRPSDPTSWFYQAAVHSVSATAIQAAQQVDPDVAKVDKDRFWNQCPHTSNQSSAEFLLWHRAYLYYFERILRAATGDAGFSIPYWNYTVPTQRGFPLAFAAGDEDPVTGAPRNPLFDHRRELAFTSGNYDLSEGAAGTTVLFQETNFFGPTEASGFAGGIGDSNPSTRGRIEQQPHDAIHFAIGGAVGTGEVANPGTTVGMMASVRTAAFDPIFWVHHTNIDRLWSQWECLDSPPRVWGTVPPQAWFDAKPWFFNDRGGQVVNQSRSHYLDRRNFQVAYDSDQPQCKPLSSKPFPKPSGAGSPGASPLAIEPDIVAFVFKAEAGAQLAPGRVGPDAPHAVEIPLGTLPDTVGGSAKNSIMSSKKSAPRRVMLEIEQLRVEGITSVGFDVYINQPPGAPADRTSAAFVGTVALFGAVVGDEHAHGADTAASQRFDISRAIVADTFDLNKARVSIVPFDLLTPRAGQPRLRRPVGISYGPMRILILEGSSNAIM